MITDKGIIFGEAIKDIKETLECEKKNFDNSNKTNENCEGWIEALEYVLRKINPNKYDEDEIFISEMEGKEL